MLFKKRCINWYGAFVVGKDNFWYVLPRKNDIARIRLS